MTVLRIPPRSLADARHEHLQQRAAREEKWLQWLIAFVEKPIENLAPVDRDELNREIKAFASFRVDGLVATPAAAASSSRLTVNQLRRLQKTLANALATLWPFDPATPPVSVPLPARSTGVFIGRLVSTGQVQTFTRAEWPSTFWLVAVGLLQAHGPRIRRCMSRRGTGRCGRLFVRTRRQLFCSPACSRRELARRWYERHHSDAAR